MTTINNLTIEQMREIVRGAPKRAERWLNGMYLKQGEWTWWWSSYVSKWLQFEKHIYGNSKFEIATDLNDLRTAISEHDTTQLCIGCGSPDLHKGGEIKEPKMCLDCFAEMVGFTRTSNGFVESDHVTDIRNHVSPSTKVIDHE